MTEPGQALADLWSLAGGDPTALAQVTLTGREPVLPGHFLVGSAATATIAAAGLAAVEIWRVRCGSRQNVSVDMRAAAAEFRSESYLGIDGKKPADPWAPVSGYYRTGDGRWILLHCNFPHHRAGTLRLLGCEESRDGAIIDSSA